jgi:hypothetical protein
MTRPDDDLEPRDHLDPLDEDPAERDIEAPTADAAEQAAPVTPGAARVPVRLGWEVGEWDAAEQSVVVDLDEDDYR